ncbi:hypothetical protein [Acinetobacter guillouiae]|uniref:hypothetical protein n=1 Tax=Acinetobacter guillouiae TaxID=106649 RepID=UPI0026E3958F|nr:hypothetical protein [Acinetobacter guillouiae]MDO6644327.1 hypothetical protein [Acinetobacter guillouiae]
MLNKNFDLATTLIIIYLALLSISIALYALIQIYVDDKGTATNLMIWSATLFPTIALLYTFNTWRKQKGSEVLSKLSEILFFEIKDFFDISEKIMEEHRDDILNKVLNNIEIPKSKSETELTNNLDLQFNNIIHKVYLIYKYTNNDDIKKYVNEFNVSYIEYTTFRKNIYFGMKIIERTETTLRSIAIDKNNKDDYLNHRDELSKLYVNLNKSASNLSEEIFKYIFHIDDKSV